MAIPKINYTYTGKVQPPSSAQTQSRAVDEKLYPYLPDADLVEAVNLSIDLDRPLLLEGDPGCGKTCLAEALAYEFGKTNKQDWPYFRWDVKSSSRGKDGLYTFDAVGRLRDAQMLGANLSELENFLAEDDFGQLKERLKDKRKYLEFGALGKAIQQTDRRAVVLIDEVDKADSDFCNDLLLELDRYEFKVPEISDTEIYKNETAKPIVILTSNREKPLPAPFLRRCIYFYVTFPTGDRLNQIVQRRFDSIAANQTELVERAIEHISEVRELLESKPGSRPPGTSEFLDFLGALLRRKDPEQAMQDLNHLADRLPLLGTLLKTETDQALYRRKFGRK